MKGLFLISLCTYTEKLCECRTMKLFHLNFYLGSYWAMTWRHIIFSLTVIIFCAFRFSQETPCSLYMNTPKFIGNRNWRNILFFKKLARDEGEWPLLFVSLSNCGFEAYRLLCSLLCLATARSVKLSVETIRVNKSWCQLQYSDLFKRYTAQVDSNRKS